MRVGRAQLRGAAAVAQRHRQGQYELIVPLPRRKVTGSVGSGPHADSAELVVVAEHIFGVRAFARPIVLGASGESEGAVARRQHLGRTDQEAIAPPLKRRATPRLIDLEFKGVN